MTRNLHDEARELIALGEGLPDAQQVWLRAHLNECEACRNYAEAANRVVRSLRSLPLAADSRLVRATQMRVRFHASRLHETRERLWLVGMACLGVGLSVFLRRTRAGGECLVAGPGDLLDERRRTIAVMAMRKLTNLCR